MSSAGQSNVGFRSIYETRNQRRVSQSEIEELRRETGKNVQGFLPKGQLDKVNKLHGQEIERQREEAFKHDPTLVSQWHGNQPSKGALIDKELQEEDEAILRRKQDATAGKKF